LIQLIKILQESKLQQNKTDEECQDSLSLIKSQSSSSLENDVPETDSEIE